MNEWIICPNCHSISPLSSSILRQGRGPIDELLRGKLGSHHIADIVGGQDLLLQKAGQFEQLRVVGTLKPRFNGYPVVDLIAKGVRRIVHQDGATEIPSEHIQIFEEISFDAETGVAKEAMVDQFPVCYQIQIRKQVSDWHNNISSHNNNNTYPDRCDPTAHPRTLVATR